MYGCPNIADPRPVMNCDMCSGDIYAGDLVYDFGFEDKICQNCIDDARKFPRVKCANCGAFYGDDDVVFIRGIAFCEKCIDKKGFEVMEEEL